MRKYLLLLIAVALMSFSFAQKTDNEIAADFSDLTLELDEAIAPKLFQKTWKEVRGKWEDDVRNAIKPKQLCDLLIRLEESTKKEKVFSSEWLSERNKWIKSGQEVVNWEEYSKLLIEFESYLKSSAYSDKWDGYRLDWNKAIRQTCTDFQMAEKVKNPDVHIDKQFFKEEFQNIFRQCVKGLDAIRVGDGVEREQHGKKMRILGTAQKLPGAKSTNIVYDSGIEVSMFNATYFCGSTKENAKRIWKQIGDVVSASIPDGFLKQEKYAADFVDYKEIYFEWNSDKFADVQKRPTVEIGISKDSNGDFTVVIKIAEPYFKNQYKF